MLVAKYGVAWGRACVVVVGRMAPIPFWRLPHTSVLSSNRICVYDNIYMVLMLCHVFYGVLQIIYLQVTTNQLKVSLKVGGGTAKFYS
jgi:hypothetical protein